MVKGWVAQSALPCDSVKDVKYLVLLSFFFQEAPARK